MTGFILQRIDDGAYVAKYGIRSYTRTIEKAHIWTRKEYAEAEKCGNERVVAVEDILQSTDYMSDLQAFTEEEYLCVHGASPDWGDAGNHSPRAHISGAANRAISKRTIERDQALILRRAELREEYKRELEAGRIREPTATEQRIRVARGHPDNAATMAARRLLEKRGIDWRPKENEDARS